jgi:hypothetical protein
VSRNTEAQLQARLVDAESQRERDSEALRQRVSTSSVAPPLSPMMPISEIRPPLPAVPAGWSLDPTNAKTKPKHWKAFTIIEFRG